jgi:hypothetical protein
MTLALMPWKPRQCVGISVIYQSTVLGTAAFKLR